jgi:hypothetical protein
MAEHVSAAFAHFADKRRRKLHIGGKMNSF